ncbi:MAG: adenylate/guanylate cyclase domain-containing protein [Desulfobacteraceae bacterium]|nr:adenylate/guanylate cyclase domain-containing protein [Desulfobacteraceae bacterium]
MVDNSGKNEKVNQPYFKLFRKRFLFLQKKYEEKINELSILKEMVESMKSIDLTDQDLVWRRQLDCLIKYKNLSGAVFYLFKDFQQKKNKYISSSFDMDINYSFLKDSNLLKKIIEEKENVLIEDLDNWEACIELTGSLYALPVISGEELYGALILFKNKRRGFKNEDRFFYSIVRDHLINTIAFRRFYSDKINEEKHIFQFSRFFSHSVVKKILRSGNPQLGGKKKRACVVFADLEGFTALSEKITAEEVVEVLNYFFSAMIPIVFKNNGTLDKLMGDCVMAIFGAPIDDERCSLQAVTAVLQMFEAFHLFKRDLGGRYGDLKMSVGINTGDLIAGFLGSESHMNYTVIGDTVNCAQRLQALANGSQIYMSRRVFNDIKADIEHLNNIESVSPIGKLKLKGKQRSLDGYRIIPKIY